nr:reverse transcriptase domain-containing protein [Tanacetum cinerariifolium]
MRKQNFDKREDFRNQQRYEQRCDKFMLLTKSLREILAMDKSKFKALPQIQIKELIKAGKLLHVIKELKQGSEKDQLKAAKKGEGFEKDKAMAIVMVQPWQKAPSGSEKPNASTHCTILWFQWRNHMANWTNITIGKNRGCETFNLYMDELYGSKIIISIQRDHRKAKNMTGVLWHIAEHRLNICEGCPLVRRRYVLGIQGKHQRDKVCQDKVEAVLRLSSPKCVKVMQKLNEKLASLNRFLSKSAEKSLPFFKTLRKCTKKSDFQWITKAEAAFKQMKILIAELPTLTAPMEKEELILYLAAAREAVSVVTRISVKRQIMADFIVERPEDDPLAAPTEVEEELLDPWTLFTDGSSCIDGFEAIIILTDLKGTEYTYALRFKFDATNNEAETSKHKFGRRSKGMIRTKAMIPAEIGMPTLQTIDRRGDLVYRSNNASHGEDERKLGPKWEGPYEVTKALGKGAYKLKDCNGKLLL